MADYRRDYLDAGFDPEYVVGDVDRVMCAICTNVCEDPAEASCGHVFCRAHIQEWLRTHETCPLDRQCVKLKERPGEEFLDLLRDLRLRCEYESRGCTHRNVLDTPTYRKHVLECGFAPVSCTWKGCKCKDMNRRDLESHKRECPYRIVACDLECGEEMPFKNLEHHKATVCPLLPMLCAQGCGATIKRGDMKEHITVHCPRTLVPCPVQCCEDEVYREEVQAHLQDPAKMVQHILALSSSLQEVRDRHESEAARQALKIKSLERKHWARVRPTQFEAHITRVEALVTDGNRLYTGSWDSTIKVWDIFESETPSFVMTFYGHDNWVNTLVVHKDRLFSGSKDKTIRVWDITVTTERAYLACKATLSGHTGVVSALAVNDSGDRLFSSSWDHTILMWDVSDTSEEVTCLLTLKNFDEWGRTLTARGSRLFSGSKTYGIKVWEIAEEEGQAASAECILTLEGHTASVSKLVAHGDRLFSASWDNTVRMWDTTALSADTACLATFTGHTDDVTSLAVSGDWLFTGSDDTTLRVWDTSTAHGTVGQAACVHRGERIVALCASEDRLFSSASDDALRVWS